MPFHLRKATPADISAMRDIYLDAFHDDLLTRQIYPPSSPETPPYWSRALTKELAEPNATFLVLVPDDQARDDTRPALPREQTRKQQEAQPQHSEASQIIGFVKWVLLSPALPRPPLDPASEYPTQGLPSLAVTFYDTLSTGHHRITATRDRWCYLDLLAVHPPWSGRGASRPLMAWGLDTADAEGLPCLVESTERARPYYEHFGFHVVDQMAVNTPEGVVRVFFMVREPSPAS